MRPIPTVVCLAVLYLLSLVTYSMSAFAEGNLTTGSPDSEVSTVDELHSNSGLDPNIDTDGDGVINSLEYRFGTDPTDINSKPVGIYYVYDSFGRIREIIRFTTP